MKKILAVLFACSIVLAGCMDLTDEDIDKIVDAIVEIPGCNADETAYNYDVNATNNNACLTEMVLKNSIADFITLMDNGPGQDQTMGMSMTGSGDMEGQQMDWTSVNVYSPDGSYTSMELDLGMLVWSQSQLITSAADGTTLMQVNHNGAQMLMNSATDFSSWNSMDDDDMGDDDMDMGGNDMDNDNMEMSLPEVEVPADFDPSTALFEAGLATDNGYSFSTTMDDGMGYSMTMTFTLGMDLVVNSMTLTETMDGESSTSSITMLEESILMGYLTIDSTLPYQALPFGVSPMGGMGSGDNDMGDNVDWEPYYGGYCEWEGDSGDEANVWYCKDDESDNDWDTWWYYCELHDGDWHCTDDFGQSSDYENSADLEQYDADEGHDHGDDVPDNFYVDAFLTDNWANSLNDYADPEFTINAGFEDVDNVQFDLYDSDGMEITTLTILPSDFTDQGDGNMIYYVDIDHLMVDEGCYTLTATVTSYDNNYQGEWIRDDICIYDTGNDDDGSDDSNVDEWEFDCIKFVDTNYVINDENGAPSFDDSWNAEGLDYITNLCDNQDANNPDTYQIDSSHAGDWESTDITGWFIDGENNIIESMNWIFVNSGVYIVNQGSDDCDGVYDADADTCTEDTGVTVTDSDELLMIWSLEDEDGNVLNNKILYQFNFQTKSGVMAAIVMKENTFMCDDGEEISYEYVNDGEEDCLGGEDEGSNDDGDDGHDDHGDNDDAPTAQELINMTDTDDSGTMNFDEFIEYLNSPDPDAENGDDESFPQSVVDDINAIFDNNDADMSGDLDVDELDPFILEIDEYFMSMDGGDGELFTCDNGNEVPADYVDDGENDCGDWSDEPNHNDNGDDSHAAPWTFNREMSECDSDADGMVDFDELDACVTNDLVNDGYGDEEILDFYGWFDWVDADDDSMLDSNEYNDFAEMTSEGPMMVCYYVSSDEVDLSITSEEYCDAANTMWTEALQSVNDGDDGMDDSDDEIDVYFTCDNGYEIFAMYVDDGDNDCGDWSDEPNHNDNGDGNDDHSDDGHDDNGNHGSMFDWMISNSQDMPMEGSFDDYTIVLAMCTMDESSDDGMDMGMGTTPAMNCGDDVLSVTIADAMAQDAVVMFHDADMSGTITGGDMVHISPDIDVDGDWNTVRLYSTSADSYSDENPMLTPGFTGALGMLALLGAALLTRRD